MASSERVGKGGRSAECNSAIQQNTILRYGETDRGNRAPQPHPTTRHHRQRRKPALRLAAAAPQWRFGASRRKEQREIIGRIHLHHFAGDNSRARDQPHLRRLFDHMFVGDGEQH